MSTIAAFGVLAGGGAYAASKIGAEDIAKNAVRGKHVQANAVGGSDIAESKLGPVPSAFVGGFGRSSTEPGACNPEDVNFVPCAVVTAKLPSKARMLLMGQATVHDPAGYGGDCRLASTGGPFEETTTRVLPGSEAPRVTLVFVTRRFPRGQHSFGIDCNQHPDTDALASFDEATITAVGISPK
jgi:hypothetical protein